MPSSTAPAPPAPLTEAEKLHFLRHGWLKLPGCFTASQAAEVTADVWTRLGASPTDKSTWTSLRTNMPWHRSFDASAFAPRAWSAICELLGGEDRVSPESRLWKDGLIVNLGSAELEGKPTPPQDLEGWHVDGDFFVHYLDSPEQALLVIPLFSDVVPDGGGTVICPRAIPHVAKHLFDHPEGVSPRMVPRAMPDFKRERNLAWFNALAKRCAADAEAEADGDAAAALAEHALADGVVGRPGPAFVEATGRAGDVYLLHPLMLHSASTNPARAVRIITNPPVAVAEPFRFGSSSPAGAQSVVEQVTARAVRGGGGEERDLAAWHITAPREGVVPERVRIQERMKAEELRRLEEARKGVGAAA